MDYSFYGWGVPNWPHETGMLLWHTDKENSHLWCIEKRKEVTVIEINVITLNFEQFQVWQSKCFQNSFKKKDYSFKKKDYKD